MRNKGKERKNQRTKEITSYSTVQKRLKRHFEAVESWLTDPKQQRPSSWNDVPPKKLQEMRIPADQQLPIYQPNTKILVFTQKAFSYTLSQYLKKEKEQHQGKHRILSIPLYVDDHWAVLTLHINQKNQVCAAIYIDSLRARKKQPFSSSLQHPIVESVKKAYPDYQKSVLQYQHYHHPDIALSKFIMAENAGDSIRHIYSSQFPKLFPLHSTLWGASLPKSTRDPKRSTFEEALPDELKMYALSFLTPQVLDSIFRRISKHNATLANDSSYWKSLYHAWSKYTFIPTPAGKTLESQDYKTAFKQLYLSITPENRVLVQAAVDGNQNILNQYQQDKTLFEKYRLRLLVIATCQGKTELLTSMKCSIDDIQQLALVNYSVHAKNRQAVLDYFWGLIDLNKLPTNDSKNTTAHWAALLNQPTALADILEKNPELAHQTNSAGITPLMFAQYYEHTQCAEILKLKKALSRNTKPDFYSAPNMLECLKFGDAVSAAVLLANRVNPNLKDKKLGYSALYFAVGTCHIDIIRLLLQHGANPNFKSTDDWTPLIFAAEKGRTRIVRLLLQHGANPNSHLSSQNIPGSPALMLAAQKRQKEIVRLLLQHGANPNPHLTSKYTRSSPPLLFAVEKGYTDIIRLLLQHGASPNSYDFYRTTALMLAAKKGQKEIVLLLLHHGANPNSKDCDYSSALMFAVEKGYTDIIRLLLKYDAYPESYLHHMFYSVKTRDTFKITSSEAVAMFLKLRKLNRPITLKQAYHKDPEGFITLIQNILNDKEYWPWVTEKMRDRIRRNPFIQQLHIAEQSTGSNTLITDEPEKISEGWVLMR